MWVQFNMRKFRVIFATYVLATCQPICAHGSIMTTAKPTNVCSMLLGGVKQVVDRFKNKAVSTHAREIILGWEALPLQKVDVATLENSEQTFFVGVADAKQAPFGVLGKIKVISIGEEGVIALIVDGKNRSHVIDARLDEIELRIPTIDGPQEMKNLNFISDLTDDYFFGVELQRAGVGNLDDDVTADQLIATLKGLESPLSGEAREKVVRVYQRISNVAVAGLMASAFLWGGTLLARMLGHGTDSFLVQHSSNFYMGLAGMALIHSTLAAGAPEKRGLILSATIWGAVAFNIGTEIFGPDWIDMATGVFAAGFYYTTVGFIEKRVASPPSHLNGSLADTSR